MQIPLFPSINGIAPADSSEDAVSVSPEVSACEPSPSLLELAATLPPKLRLGTSSWHYPGWVNLVWDRDYPAALLPRQGLSAYAKHPLFRTLSLDRTF